MKITKIIFCVLSLLSFPHIQSMELKKLERGDYKRMKNSNESFRPEHLIMSGNKSDSEEIELQNMDDEDLTSDKLEVVHSRKNPYINYKEGCEFGSCKGPCLMCGCLCASTVVGGGLAFCCTTM